MAEYKDYGFHLEPAQLVGIPLLVVLGLLGAAIYNVRRLFSRTSSLPGAPA